MSDTGECVNSSVQPARRYRKIRADFWCLLALIVVVGSFTVWWMHHDINSFTVQPYGDQAWVQASAQVAMQSGPFATNEHAGWFSGFNPWAYPGLSSLGFYVGAWLLGLVSDSSSNVLVGVMGATAVLVALATYLALRLAPPRRVVPVVAFWGAMAMGLSPYVLSKMGHYSVAAWYLLPVTIAVIGVLTRDVSARIRWLALGALALTSLISPLWWVFIDGYFLILAIAISLVLRKWRWVRQVALVLGALVVGGLLPVYLTVVNTVPGGSTNRQPWDSTYFSGSLVDFIVGSSWLNSAIPRLETVLPGASHELSAVGLIPALAAIAAVIIAAGAFIGLGPSWRQGSAWILVTLQLVLLSFLTLGLGTVQEALLALLGFESPLRGWSRLSVVVALLGMMLIAPWISDRVSAMRGWRRAPRLAVLSAATAVTALIVILDATHIVLMPPRGLPTLEELPAVQYLASQGDCPVAQLPVGSFPDFPMADGSAESITYFYRGFVPYVLNPQGKWSFGAAAGTPSDLLMRSLPPVTGTANFAALKSAGYCAVLYDKQYSNWMQTRSLDWHAQSLSGVSPSWTSERFDVYLL